MNAASRPPEEGRPAEACTPTTAIRHGVHTLPIADTETARWAAAELTRPRAAALAAIVTELHRDGPLSHAALTEHLSVADLAVRNVIGTGIRLGWLSYVDLLARDPVVQLTPAATAHLDQTAS